MAKKNLNLISKMLLLVLITGMISLFTAGFTAFAADGEPPEVFDPFAENADEEEEDDDLPQLEPEDEPEAPKPPSTPKSGPELMYLIGIGGAVAGAKVYLKARK